MRKPFALILVAVLTLAMVTWSPVATPANAAPGEVLILEPTVTGGAASTLAQKFVLAGKTPVVVNAATWSTMTAAQFDSYDAVVLGDPTCSDLGPEAAATANAAVWSSVVDGNVVIIGTDETYHESQGGDQLMEKAAAFSVAEAGKTGAYISLSCYYHDTAAGTPVPLLSGFGAFTVTGVGCFNDSHIVATHPALSGLTDATLSNWGCSVHEAFDSWPVSFEVLAIAEGIGSVFTAPDGTVGTPYILARGVEVISDIDITPASATNDIGTSHTVTATVTTDDPAPGTPIVGTTVTFSVVAGPHTGTTGTAVTDASGVASFSYPGTIAGTDTIEATFVDALGRTQRSNRVEKTWVPATGPTCGGKPATINGTPGNDTIHGTPGPDVIIGNGGNDTINGLAGDDVICTGDGRDNIVGNDGNDQIYSGGGNDSITVGAGNDIVNAGAGADSATGGAGDDIVNAGAGADSATGGAGDDQLYGEAGNDSLTGGSGTDTIDGGTERDICTGGETVTSCP